mgnify:FL=1|jgi:ABC-2 type transport system ATP-binding protein
MNISGNESVIDAQKVEFSYGSRQVLNGLSLSISPGEIFGVLGANGAGKTTFIRMLLGLVRPQSGNVLVHGKVPSSSISNQIGYMPQLSSLYQELSVRENVDFFARMYGVSNRVDRSQAVEDAIKFVDLWDRRNDSILKLSGGMRQRTSLAVAIVHHPTLLLLDEPTIGLDPDIRANFWQRFGEMSKSKSTIVLSSHTMDDAVRCHRLAFLRDGQVIALGTPMELRTATGNPDASLEDAFLYFIGREDT